jgi:dCMP deaminase
MENNYMNTKELEYFKQCYKLAQKSLDPSTQNGVILVKNDIVIGEGYNKFPSGPYGEIANKEYVWNNREVKYKLVVHAETASILDAAKKGNSTSGATMYGCWVACLDCARDIIEAGISELVGHHHKYMDDRPDWNAGIEEAFNLLRAAGVKIRIVDGEIGASLRFAGKEITV